MTTPVPTFDDSQPTVTTITLPVILPVDSSQALSDTIAQTLEQLSLLQYQAFLQALNLHWPEGVESISAQSNGISMLSIVFRNQASEGEDAPVQPGEWDLVALRWLKTHAHLPLTPLDGFFKLIKEPFMDGQRWITPAEVPGLLESALNAKTRARVQSVALDAILPTAQPLSDSLSPRM